MHYKNLTELSDFLQVLNSMRKHYTKINIFLSIAYLLQFIYYKDKN
jgi:hypothetical protein